MVCSAETGSVAGDKTFAGTGEGVVRRCSKRSNAFSLTKGASGLWVGDLAELRSKDIMGRVAAGGDSRACLRKSAAIFSARVGFLFFFLLGFLWGFLEQFCCFDSAFSARNQYEKNKCVRKLSKKMEGNEHTMITMITKMLRCGAKCISSRLVKTQGNCQ
jgi:hypothetical protein